jgi:hypothetical protein
MITYKQMLIRVDGLLRIPLKIFKLMIHNRGINSYDKSLVVAIKFMGLGSIVKLASVCDENGVDKTEVILLTRIEHREICIALGFERCVFIRLNSFFLFLIDCTNTISKVRNLNPSLIIDFERCSNAVSLFRLSMAFLARCKTVSFSNIKNDEHTRTDVVYGEDWLSHKKMFCKGLEYLPKRLLLKRSLPVSIERSMVIVNINSSDYLLTRRYSRNDFVKVIKLINEQRPGLTFYFTGVVQERAYIDKLISEISVFVINACNQAGLWSIQKLIKELSHCALFITNDSGPLHFATLLQVPTIAIWGPTQPDQFGYEKINSIRNISQSLPCSPCFVTPKSKTAVVCEGRIDCMKIAPERIAKEALEVLAQDNDQRTIFISPTLFELLSNE